MKKLKFSLSLILIVSLVVSGCSSGNRIAGGGSSKKCGCGMNRGFVGY